MKTLWLVRHAEALEAVADQSDKERPLSHAGIEQAVNLGKFLDETRARVDLMLVSSAVRTQSTAEILLKTAGHLHASSLVIDDLYLASDAMIWNIVTSADDAIDSLMVIGHNPGLLDLVRRFMPSVQRLHTCDLVTIRFAIESWSEAGVDTVEKTALR